MENDVKWKWYLWKKQMIFLWCRANEDLLRSKIKIDVPTTKNSGRKNNFCLESDHHHQWSIDYVFWQPLLLAYSSVLEDCVDWWNTRFICKPRFLHLSLGVQGVAIYWSTLALIIRLTAFDVNDASRSGHQLQHQYANWQMSWLDILMIGYQETSNVINMELLKYEKSAFLLMPSMGYGSLLATYSMSGSIFCNLLSLSPIYSD